MNMIANTEISPLHIDEQVEIFKLLAHPARLSIMEILRHGEECVFHMEATLDYRQAYLSQQLAILRTAGIIQDRRNGWNIFYTIIKPEIYRVMDEANLLTGKTLRIKKRASMPQPAPAQNVTH